MLDLVGGETRCPCVLVLDTSASMRGRLSDKTSPIEELNKAVQQFIEDLQDDRVARNSIELAIYTISGSVQEAMPFTPMKNVDLVANFKAEGSTPFGRAMRKAITVLEERKKYYQDNGISYYQPWLVAITDGEPTDNWLDIAKKVSDMSKENKLVPIMIGVNDAKIEILQMFHHSKKATKLENESNFGEFFSWLSQSFKDGKMSDVDSDKINEDIKQNTSLDVQQAEQDEQYEQYEQYEQDEQDEEEIRDKEYEGQDGSIIGLG